MTARQSSIPESIAALARGEHISPEAFAEMICDPDAMRRLARALQLQAVVEPQPDAPPSEIDAAVPLEDVAACLAAEPLETRRRKRVESFLDANFPTPRQPPATSDDTRVGTGPADDDTVVGGGRPFPK